MKSSLKAPDKRRLWVPLDEKSTLLATSAFRLAILVPLLLAIFTAYLILTNSVRSDGVTILSQAGISQLYESLKIPFIILSTALPLTAILAGHHRSIQTKHQIDIQSSQNVFSNYIKHREIFEGFIRQQKLFSGDSAQVTVRDVQIYGVIFPLARDGVLDPDTSAFEKAVRLGGIVKLLAEKCSVLTWEDFTYTSNIAASISSAWDFLESHFFVQNVCFPSGERTISELSAELQRIEIVVHSIFLAGTFHSSNDFGDRVAVIEDMVSRARRNLTPIMEDQRFFERIKELAEKNTTGGGLTISQEANEGLSRTFQALSLNKAGFLFYKVLKNTEQREFSRRYISKGMADKLEEIHLQTAK